MQGEGLLTVRLTGMMRANPARAAECEFRWFRDQASAAAPYGFSAFAPRGPNQGVADEIETVKPDAELESTVCESVLNGRGPQKTAVGVEIISERR